MQIGRGQSLLVDFGQVDYLYLRLLDTVLPEVPVMPGIGKLLA